MARVFARYEDPSIAGLCRSISHELEAVSNRDHGSDPPRECASGWDREVLLVFEVATSLAAHRGDRALELAHVAAALDTLISAQTREDLACRGMYPDRVRAALGSTDWVVRAAQPHGSLTAGTTVEADELVASAFFGAGGATQGGPLEALALRSPAFRDALADLGVPLETLRQAGADPSARDEHLQLLAGAGGHAMSRRMSEISIPDVLRSLADLGETATASLLRQHGVGSDELTALADRLEALD